MKTKLKTPLRYPGAKHVLFGTAIIPAIDSYVPDGCVYVEPFVGGGSTVCQFVNRFTPRKIVVNDKDPSIAAVWRCVADGRLAMDLSCRIKETPVSVAEFERQREALKSKDGVDLAFARLYIGWTAFRGSNVDTGPVGGWRQNSKWNHRIEKSYKPDEISLRVLDLHDAIGSKLQVRNEDFGHLIKEFDQPGVVMYLDPPYYEVGNRLYDLGMSDEDHVRLAGLVKGVKHAFVVLSYGDHPSIRDLYRDVPFTKLKSRADICFDGKALKTTPELLMLFNPRTVDANSVGKFQAKVGRPSRRYLPEADKETLRTELEKSENRIIAGLRAFVEMGRELRRIRDYRLYRGADDTTFEDYVKRRWKMARAHAYRFIRAAECYENVSKLGTPLLPMTESQVRPIVSLPAPTQQIVWREALTISEGEQPTGEQVLVAVAKVTGRKVTKPKPPTRVAALASAMCESGCHSSLASMTASVADECLRDKICAEGDESLHAVSFGKLAQVLEGQVERRLGGPAEDREELECFLCAVRKHAEALLAKVEKAECLLAVK